MDEPRRGRDGGGVPGPGGAKEPWTFDAASRTVGLNDPNQDACLACASGDLALVGVFDGVGSASGGRVVSHAAREFFADEFDRLVERAGSPFRSGAFSKAVECWWRGTEEEPDGAARRLLRSVVTAAERENEARAERGELRIPAREFQSTMVVGLALGPSLAVLWAGDSRLHRFRDGRLELLTRDHSALMRGVAWEWSEMWDFAVGSSPITRWLSPDTPLDWIEVAVPADGLREGDVVIASSDGFYGLMYPWSFEQRVFESALEEAGAERLLARLCRGLELGRDDDTSIALTAAGSGRALAALPALSRVRLRTLGLERIPELAAHWARFSLADARSLPSYEARRDRMMEEMQRYLKDDGLASALAAAGASGGPLRLARPVGQPDPVPAEGRLTVHREDEDEEVVPLLDAQAEVHLSLPGEGELTVGWDGERRELLLEIAGVGECEVWRGLGWGGELVVVRQDLPVEILAGDVVFELTPDGLSLRGSAERRWRGEEVVVGADEVPGHRRLAVRHCTVTPGPDDGALTVRDGRSESGTWSLVGRGRVRKRGRLGITVPLAGHEPRCALLLRTKAAEVGLVIERN